MSFIFISEYLESSSVALHMKLLEKQDVKVVVTNRDYHKILEGMIEKEDNFVQFLGKKNIFIIDDADSGPLCDELRARGELVLGGSKESDRLEGDRLYGQEQMKKAGISTVKSTNFKGEKAFESAIEFIKKSPGRWVIKQNGSSTDKSLSTVGKFDNGEDVIDKLKDMKHLWTENIDFDLQEFIDGHEVGCEAWFNGQDWVRDTKGEPVFIINWEHKKRSVGDLGRTTGETGTLAYRATKDSGLAKEFEKLLPLLKRIKYFGNIDINFILSKKDMKFYGLEFTTRFGYPALNYYQEMVRTPLHEIFENTVKGQNNFMEIDPRWSVVVVVQAPPFPFDSVKDDNNAKGQRIYFTEKGKWSGRDTITLDKLKHIHLYEVKFEKETKHFLATGDSGYLLTVTAQGDSPKSANDKCLQFIKDNVYTSNSDYRTDIGVNSRVEETIKVMKSKGFL